MEDVKTIYIKKIDGEKKSVEFSFEEKDGYRICTKDDLKLIIQGNITYIDSGNPIKYIRLEDGIYKYYVTYDYDLEDVLVFNLFEEEIVDLGYRKVAN